MKIIEVSQLTKKYKDRNREGGVVHALKSCSFKIEEGSSIGFVGLNGAGKSTTIKLLTGIMAPNSGNITVLGKNPFSKRKTLMKDIGVLFGQRSNLVYDLPVKDSFKLLRAIYNIPKGEYDKNLQMIDSYINLKELMEVPVRKMSLGQRMRCEVASVLLHSPKIVFFDEAFLGIDFHTKRMIRKLIDSIKEKNNTTFFITSHDIKDIEKMCKEVIIINDGEIVIQDDIKNIINKSKWIHMDVEFDEEVSNEVLLEKGFEIEGYNGESNVYTFKVKRERYLKELEAMSKICVIKSYGINAYDLEEIIENIYFETRNKNV